MLPGWLLKKFILLIIFSSQFLILKAYCLSHASSDHQFLLQKFMQERISSKELRSMVLGQGTKSVPVIIQVMKEGRFPDQNRWVATFLLAQLMGVKSATFLVKFLKHVYPH